MSKQDILGTEPCVKCGKHALADSVLCPDCMKREERQAAATTRQVQQVQKANPTEQLVSILIQYIKREKVTLKPKTEIKIRSGLHKGIQDVIFKIPPVDTKS